MRLDGDLLALAVALFGLVMGFGSIGNAAWELIECSRHEPPVNGATHLSALALAVKAVLTVIAQAALAYIALLYALAPKVQIHPVVLVATLSLAALTVYDFLFHMRLYAMLKPASGSPRRRTMD